MTHNTEKDAPAPVCAECGMPGQCAGCYLMEQRGLTPPPRVIPSGDAAQHTEGGYEIGAESIDDVSPQTRARYGLKA